MKELFDKAGLPITLEEYDQMTNKRIARIMMLQHERLEERNKAMEQERQAQERKLSNSYKSKRNK